MFFYKFFRISLLIASLLISQIIYSQAEVLSDKKIAEEYLRSSNLEVVKGYRDKCSNTNNYDDQLDCRNFTRILYNIYTSIEKGEYKDLAEGKVKEDIVIFDTLPNQEKASFDDIANRFEARDSVEQKLGNDIKTYIGKNYIASDSTPQEVLDNISNNVKDQLDSICKIKNSLLCFNEVSKAVNGIYENFNKNCEIVQKPEFNIKSRGINSEYNCTGAMLKLKAGGELLKDKEKNIDFDKIKQALPVAHRIGVSSLASNDSFFKSCKNPEDEENFKKCLQEFGSAREKFENSCTSPSLESESSNAEEIVKNQESLTDRSPSNDDNSQSSVESKYNKALNYNCITASENLKKTQDIIDDTLDTFDTHGENLQLQYGYGVNKCQEKFNYNTVNSLRHITNAGEIAEKFKCEDKNEGFLEALACSAFSSRWARDMGWFPSSCENEHSCGATILKNLLSPTGDLLGEVAGFGKYLWNTDFSQMWTDTKSNFYSVKQKTLAVGRFLASDNKLDRTKKFLSKLGDSIVGIIAENSMCLRWEGETCVEPAPHQSAMDLWDCTEPAQKIQLVCSVLGHIGGELLIVGIMAGTITVALPKVMSALKKSTMFTKLHRTSSKVANKSKLSKASINQVKLEKVAKSKYKDKILKPFSKVHDKTLNMARHSSPIVKTVKIIHTIEKPLLLAEKYGQRIFLKLANKFLPNASISTTGGAAGATKMGMTSVVVSKVAQAKRMQRRTKFLKDKNKSSINNKNRGNTDSRNPNNKGSNDRGGSNDSNNSRNPRNDSDNSRNNSGEKESKSSSDRGNDREKASSEKSKSEPRKDGKNNTDGNKNSGNEGNNTSKNDKKDNSKSDNNDRRDNKNKPNSENNRADVDSKKNRKDKNNKKKKDKDKSKDGSDDRNSSAAIAAAVGVRSAVALEEEVDNFESSSKSSDKLLTKQESSLSSEIVSEELSQGASAGASAVSEVRNSSSTASQSSHSGFKSGNPSRMESAKRALGINHNQKISRNTLRDLASRYKSLKKPSVKKNVADNVSKMLGIPEDNALDMIDEKVADVEKSLEYLSQHMDDISPSSSSLNRSQFNDVLSDLRAQRDNMYKDRNENIGRSVSSSSGSGISNSFGSGSLSNIGSGGSLAVRNDIIDSSSDYDEVLDAISEEFDADQEGEEGKDKGENEEEKAKAKGKDIKGKGKKTRGVASKGGGAKSTRGGVSSGGGGSLGSMISSAQSTGNTGKLNNILDALVGTDDVKYLSIYKFDIDPNTMSGDKSLIGELLKKYNDKESVKYVVEHRKSDFKLRIYHFKNGEVYYIKIIDGKSYVVSGTLGEKLKSDV